MPMSLRVAGRLNRAALRQSFRELVRRHQTLRTVFPDQQGHPVQRVLSAPRLHLTTVDLTGLAPAFRDPESRRLAQESALKPFDLNHGPLFRTALLRSSEEEHVLLVNLHHIVSDGWSMSVFTREFRSVYEAFTRGEPSPLQDPAYPIHGLCDLAKGSGSPGQVFDEQLLYWKQQLAGGAARSGVSYGLVAPRGAEPHRRATTSSALSGTLNEGPDSGPH